MAIFAYFIVADFVIPLTAQAMVTRVVTKVASRVGGQIVSIQVKNNQAVSKGDVLFETDPSPYKLAVENARINLEGVKQSNEQLDASILAAYANVDASKIVAEQRVREAKRLRALFKRHLTSQQQFDDSESDATAANANLQAEQANLKGLLVSRGSANNSENISVRAARNLLAQAKLNLSYTKVVAEHDGIVTNLQLEIGSFAQAGSPLVALVDNDVDVIADFREKSLSNFSTNSKAYVAFDSKPGVIFSSIISSIDAGVSTGQFTANGLLATPTTSTRWVRDAQRIRLHVQLDNRGAGELPAGARATVQLVPNNVFAAFLSKLQIYFISILHYIY